MINPLSNQNYFFQYAVGQTASPPNNPIASQPQAGISTSAISEIQSNKRSQEIGPQECKTCKARKYKDQSADSSVSMQSPTHLSPNEAGGAVIAHEQQHVQHNAEKANREGMKATSSVQIHTSVCPECGRMYVSGGTTTTSYSPKEATQAEESKGLFVNARA